MPEAKPKAAPKKKAAPAVPQAYKNVSSVNVFTQVGRAMPGEIVELTPAQASIHKGLEKVDG